MIILGISIGTRTTGIVILKNNRLLGWHNHSFLGRWTEAKCVSIIEKYEAHIKKHNVRIVVVKTPPFTHHTDRIKDILVRLDQLVMSYGCLVEFKTIHDVKAIYPQITNANELAIEAVELFPDLLPLQNRELKNKRRHYRKVFEAALIAYAKSR